MFKQLLSRGSVFAGKFNGIDHEKYFIVAGISQDNVYCCSVFINSNIPPFIYNNRSLLDLQVNIKGSKYDFLHYDSFAACNSIQRHFVDDIAHCRYLGQIDTEDLNNITKTVINSGLLAQKEIDQYFDFKQIL